MHTILEGCVVVMEVEPKISFMLVNTLAWS